MEQLKINFEDQFCQYDAENPQVYDKFKMMTLQTIGKGFKNYGAKGIVELIRWHTGVSGNDQFKINNNYTAFYARKFENEFPASNGFFRKRNSKYD
jgi:hypothetical protein